MQNLATIGAGEAAALIAAALDRAVAAKLAVSVGVVDCAGYPVALHRMDGARVGTAAISLAKARTAALLHGPSSALAQMVRSNPALLSLEGYLPLGGGVPVTDADGAVVGAVGVSGGSEEEDEGVARAAVASFAAGR